MPRLSLLAIILTASTVSLHSAGCGPDSSAESKSAQVDEPIEISGSPPGLGDIDEHGDQGPHGGHIIELGRKHEYHAELVGDQQTGTVSVYILDQGMNGLPVEQQVIRLHITVADDVTSYQLAPFSTGVPSASRFDITDRDLCRVLEDLESVTGKLRVTIDGKPFVGRITDNHHPGCAHSHEH